MKSAEPPAEKAKPLRLEGKTFTNAKGDWIKIEWASGNDISYNVSGAIQWAGGKLRCTRTKMKAILAAGGYLDAPPKPKATKKPKPTPVEALAATLEAASNEWRRGQGYTGSPVHRAGYWEALAAFVIANPPKR